MYTQLSYTATSARSSSDIVAETTYFVSNGTLDIIITRLDRVVGLCGLAINRLGIHFVLARRRLINTARGRGRG